MSKRRKGVSLEEKRERLLQIYHESKEVFNLKEVEKLGAKAGIGSIRSLSQYLHTFLMKGCILSAPDH